MLLVYGTFVERDQCIIVSDRTRPPVEWNEITQKQGILKYSNSFYITDAHSGIFQFRIYLYSYYDKCRKQEMKEIE